RSLAFDLLRHLRDRLMLRCLAMRLEVILLHARHDFPELDAAVSDGGINIIRVLAVLLAAYRFEEILQFLVRKLDVGALELAIQLGSALHNVFLALFALKPLADLAARLARLGNLKPIPA